MDLKTRDWKLSCLNAILDHKGKDHMTVASQLCEVWIDGLWQVSHDSFEDFCQSEFNMSEIDALVMMKATGEQFPEDIRKKIDKQFQRLA